MASRQRREKAAQGLADRKAALKQQRDKIENDQSFIDARQAMQDQFGVDVTGEMVAGLDEAVALIEWLENYLNLDVGPNRK